jgi:hypothetical protein
MYLVKTDEFGDTLWTRTYGGDSSDIANSMALTSDGGFVLAGYTNSSGEGGLDVYLVRTDSVGDTLWTRTYGGAGSDLARSVVQATDGGFIVGGRTTSSECGSWAMYILRLDHSGDTLWTRTFGCTPTNMRTTVEEAHAGGVVFSGTAGSGWDRHFIIIKTNSMGDSLWTSAFGAGTENYSMAKTSDGGYIFTGVSASYPGDGRLILIKTDDHGHVH